MKALQEFRHDVAAFFWLVAIGCLLMKNGPSVRETHFLEQDYLRGVSYRRVGENCTFLGEKQREEKVVS